MDRATGRAATAKAARVRAWLGALLASLALAPRLAAAAVGSDLGHKTLGVLGLGAGSLPPASGAYVGQRILYYGARALYDRNGEKIAGAFAADATALGLGVTAGYEIRSLGVWLGASAAMPVAQARVESERLDASLDRFGLGDLYVQPLRLGARLPQVDLSLAYAFYAPTAPAAIGGGEGIGQGLLVDITRGDSIQIQGGIGGTVGPVELGLVGFAQWQVRDDRGADLPAVLRGARDETYGLGPELAITMQPIRTRLFLRYVQDIAVKSRPHGQLFVVGLTVIAWRVAP